MLKVDQYSYIRTAHRVYGKKIKQIARETGHSKNTIKKVLRGEYSGYKPRLKQPYPILGAYLKIIDKWLHDDKAHPKKQRHTAVRVYNRLRQEHNFKGSETTVRRYVREAKLRLGVGCRQVFIPSDPQVGVEAEVDWGRCHAIIGGELTPLKLFCIRSKYSGKHFVRCYPCERQQALFDGHIQAFSFFGGIFPVLIYDNLTTAVQKVLRGKKRQLQQSYDKFRGYYNFTPRFCNPGQGHEKGGVEGLVGYARRNYMVPVPEAETLEQLNDKLLADCLSYGDHRIAGRDQTVNELYEQERHQLISLPDIAFSNLETSCGKVDKYSTVVIDKNRYSVPTHYAYLKVNVVLYVQGVEIFYGSKKIASHQRLYGNNKWSLVAEHYLKLIAQRPQAFYSARPIVQWRQHWPSCLERLLDRFCQKQGDTKGIKEFISVLMLYKDHDSSEIELAVEKALFANASCSQAVEHILKSSQDNNQTSFAPLDNWQTLPPPDITVYQQIGGGQ
ncbi:MAG: IS21 family transposase [Desulfobacteraceae bacterium]|nr:MAG: IS21 family transposase [Desulfobacteraceae bacterium]